eukprot:gene7832-5636_t
MAALINIAGATPIHDPAYRYKMPKLQVKVEGRGNGIKTVLLNVDDLGLALKRDASEITKFFGCELGAQTTFTDRAIVNGAHRDADLQQHLCKYIDTFVLCRNCRYPETHYRVKDEIIAQKCLACGHKETVDMTHKLCTFILGNYKRAKDAAKAAEKAEKKKDKKDANNNGATATNETSGKDGGKEKKDKKEKKEKKDKKDKKEKKDKKAASSSATSATAGGGSSSDEDHDDVPDSVFEKLSLKDKAKKAISPAPGSERSLRSGDDDDASSVGQHSDSDDDEETEAQVLESAAHEYRAWTVSHPDATAAERYDQLRAMQLTFSLLPQARLLLYLSAVCGHESFLTDNTLGKEQAFLHFLVTPTSDSSNVVSLQRQVLSAFEWLSTVKLPSSNTAVTVSKLCMQLYELEVVEEDAFTAWAQDTVLHEFSAAAQYGLT